MRSDLLSKRLYYVGWFGLPWLWIVHVLYHWNVVIPEEEPTTNPTTTTTNNTPVRLEQDDNILNINPDDRKLLLLLDIAYRFVNEVFRSYIIVCA